MINMWYSGLSEITSYHPEEMLGTKLRALYQRRKGRDLFDLWCGLSKLELDNQKIIYCFRQYLNFVIGSTHTRKQFEINMSEKMTNPEFLRDTEGLLRPGFKYDPVEAYKLVRKELIELI